MAPSNDPPQLPRILHLLAIQDPDAWVVVGLELDMMAQGGTREEALDSFFQTAKIHNSRESKLERLSPAQEEYRAKAKDVKAWTAVVPPLESGLATCMTLVGTAESSGYTPSYIPQAMR